MNLLSRLDISRGLSGVKANSLIPDGIFAIKHKENGKALLFFLEVDLDNETLVGRRKNTNTVYHKILGYREIYRNDYYIRFEKAFASTFNGFRLLFLAINDARVAALCRFTRASHPSDFIWLTDQTRMFDHGLSANIWIPGGRYEDSRKSILGSDLACEFPLIPTIR
jgi:hypothetical protein